MSGLTTKGKLPPQATDIEKVVLGGMLIDKRGVDECMTLIKSPKVFYSASNQKIFAAIHGLYQRAEAVDIMTVTEELKRMGQLDQVGGVPAVVGLSNAVGSAANMEYHARILIQKYILREFITFGQRMVERSYDDTADVFEIMETMEAGFTSITEMINRGKAPRTWSDVLTEVPKRVEFLTNNESEVTGVPTGLSKTDRFFGGWQPTDLILIGARPGMGKTAFIVNNMVKAAKAGYRVGFVSLEMSDLQLAIRAVSVNSNYHMKQLNQTGFEHPKYFEGLNRVVGEMQPLPIMIDDRPGLTIGEIKSRARTWKRKEGLDILFVDYIQLAGGHSDPRLRTEETSRGLKHIAKELEIPVVGLSQLNRSVETRGGTKRPFIADLKEASGLEQDADVIAFLYRPAYYAMEPDESILSHDENTELIVAKNRNGGIGTIGIWFEENKTKFMDYAPVESAVSDGEGGVPF